MTDTMTDPFAEARAEFLSIADLDGRLVVIVPKEIKSREGTNGKPYDYVVSDVIVFDGETTDLIPSLPHTVEDMHLSAGMVVSQIRQHATTKRPVIGRVNSKPSRTNRQVMAYGLGEPTQADKATARAETVAYLERRKAQSDPFAS